MKRIRRVLVTVVGGSVLLIGLALIVLPGPAFLAIPLGLAILASEFAWAKHGCARRARSSRCAPGTVERKSLSSQSAGVPSSYSGDPSDPRAEKNFDPSRS